MQAVVRELRGEKIDIITWTQDPRVFIAEALNWRRSKGWHRRRKVGLGGGGGFAIVAGDREEWTERPACGASDRLEDRHHQRHGVREKEKAEQDRDIKAVLAEETEAQRQQDEARLQPSRRTTRLGGHELNGNHLSGWS